MSMSRPLTGSTTHSISGGDSERGYATSPARPYSRKARLVLNLYTLQNGFDAYKAFGVKLIAHPGDTRELILGTLRMSSECPVMTQKIQEKGGLKRHRYGEPALDRRPFRSQDSNSSRPASSVSFRWTRVTLISPASTAAKSVPSSSCLPGGLLYMS